MGGKIYSQIYGNTPETHKSHKKWSQICQLKPRTQPRHTYVVVEEEENNKRRGKREGGGGRGTRKRRGREEVKEEEEEETRATWGQTDPVHKMLRSAVSRQETLRHYYDYCGTSIRTCNTSTHPGLMPNAANRKVYKRTHFLLFTGSGGSNAARIASSKTFFNPFWKQIKKHIKHNFREAKYLTCSKH